MTLITDKYRIKNHKFGTYVLQKKIGSQYKESSYFTTLASAIKYLFDVRLEDETADVVIDCIDKLSSSIAKAELIKRIEAIRDEIVEVLDA
jgi:hypothetical protein